MNKSLNITFFGFAPLTYGGGYETYIMKVIQKLSKRGHRINVITGNQALNNIESLLFFHKFLEKRLSKNSISSSLDNIKMYEYGMCSLIPFSKSFNEIKEVMESSDIIYTRNEITDFLIIDYFCKKQSPPIICGIHTSIFYPFEKSLTSKLHNILYKKSFYGKLLNKSSIILTQNNFDTKLLISDYKIEKSKIVKLLPFVDTDFFHPRKIRRTDSRFRVLFAGRLTEQKGIDILCKSIEHLSNLPEFSNMSFTIAGSGELDYMIKDLAKRFNNIEFLGFVSDEKLVNLYNSHDVVVLPSRWETALKVVLEAQACGLPVIVSDIPGPNELIIPNKTGLLINPEDYQDLSERVLKLFQLKKNNKKRYETIRKASVENTKKYSADRVIGEIEKLFYQISDSD